MTIEQEATARSNTTDETTFSVIDEQLVIDIEKRETGAVRVRKVDHEEMQEIPVTLRTESVNVERVVINRVVDAEFEPRQEGDTLVIPVFEYQPVVEMRLMLKEEVRITRTVVAETATRQMKVRKEKLLVERREGTAGEWVEQDLPLGVPAPQRATNDISTN
ncbi:YsnF/AvaK domain-containing protein [Robbsia sp. Bb-Pol-6]|uniref:YsnF/AvaK domain-containing protein n=1 Tax=Robbsia betulipollinis TaxID=2981849 RepID=A0ABT3ZTD5_9BURK|nr:YsnF/AvaK domain-containing protein [Robbsia betulipollinis]MCY0389816.1 YsnF/AvaK domain-containing protein [Robbsia betulipollinis]